MIEILQKQYPVPVVYFHKSALKVSEESLQRISGCLAEDMGRLASLGRSRSSRRPTGGGLLLLLSAAAAASILILILGGP